MSRRAFSLFSRVGSNLNIRSILARHAESFPASCGPRVGISDDILDDMFHGCAFAAYVEEAVACGGPPCEEKTRRRAFRLYEETLVERQGRKEFLPEVTDCDILAE